MQINIFYLTIIACSFYSLCSKNLIWGGDFQYYPGPFNSYGAEFYTNIPSNMSNWYHLNHGAVQIKMNEFYYTTKCVDLSGQFPMTLCQNVNLTVGHKYRLNYSLFADQRLQNMTLKATLNGIAISTLHLPDPLTFGKKADYFYAQSDQNQLCFNQTHDPTPSATVLPSIVAYGGLLDNISLIQADYYQISFKFDVSQENSQIRLISSFLYNQTIADYLQGQLFFQVFNMTFSAQIYSLAQQGNKLRIKILPNFSFALSQMQMVQMNSKSMQMIFLNLSLIYSEEYFLYLSSTEKQIIKNSQEILKFIGQSIYKILLWLKFTACSYIVFSFLRFENLSLFYIFLNIRAVPLFVRQIYGRLLQLFTLPGIGSQLQRVFGLHQNPLSFKEEENEIQELISPSNQDYIWFGPYGFTSLFFNNNLDSFFLLGVLIVKLYLLKYALKFISKKKLSKLERKNQLSIVFIVEVLDSVPSFVVSAVPRVLNSLQKFTEKFQKVAQSSILLLCMFFVSLYLIQTQGISKIIAKNNNNITSTQGEGKKLKNSNISKSSILMKNNKITWFIQQKKPLQIKKDNRVHFTVIMPNLNNQSEEVQKNRKVVQSQISANIIKKRRRKENQCYNEMFYNILVFVIPFCACLGFVELFLSINTIIIIARTVYFYRKNQIRSKIHFMLEFLANIVWIAHNTVFVIFYFIDANQSSIKKQDFYIAVRLLGLISIFTVLTGSILQLVKLALDFIEAVIYYFKATMRWLKIRPKDAQDVKRSTCTNYARKITTHLQEKSKAIKNLSVRPNNLENNKQNHKLKVLKLRIIPRNKTHNKKVQNIFTQIYQ